MFSVCFNQTKHWRSCSLNQNVISTNQRVLRPAKPTEKQRIVLGRDLATCDEELCENGDRKDKKIIVKNKVNFWKLSLCNRVAWMVLLVELFGCIKHAWDNKNKKKAKMMLLLLVYNRCSEIAHFFDFFISWIFFCTMLLTIKAIKLQIWLHRRINREAFQTKMFCMRVWNWNREIARLRLPVKEMLLTEQVWNVLFSFENKVFLMKLNFAGF